MSAGPKTFRDHTLSLFQSAAADVARQIEEGSPNEMRASSASGRGRIEGPYAGLDRASVARDLRAAADDVAAARARGEPLRPGVGSPEGVASTARSCAAIGLRFLEAMALGDAGEVTRLEGEFVGSTCDPRWASTLKEYAGYFGLRGSRRDIPYIRPAEAGAGAVEIKAGARVALIADWGTGAEPARRIARHIAALHPDVVVHLGDIYYSGTPLECRRNFEEIIADELDRRRTGVPVFTLAGNHDMYCGGVGFYELLNRLNPEETRQRASFFCLRSADQTWQLLAIDTGLHDYNPLGIADALTRLEPDEVAWHEARVREFPGRTVLLSHHQLFSAFSRIGPAEPDGSTRATNPNLLAVLERLQSERPVAAWFWGHEHSLCVYQPYAGLRRGRCIGHGGVPVFTTENLYEVGASLRDPPSLVPGTALATDGDVYRHGFAMLILGEGTEPARAEYYSEAEGRAEMTYQEEID